MNRPPLNHNSTNGSKTSYQSVPSGPSVGYYSTAQSQPFDPLYLPSRKTAQVLRILVITLVLALALLIPVAVWAWYVFIRERTVIDQSNLLVFTTAGPTQFLLIATVSTTVTKALLGPLIGLYAFTASADWLISSELGLHHRLPSPVHLGTLLAIFQSVSIVSLFNAMKGAGNRKQLAWPPVLKKAVALLVWLLFLGYALTTVSLWLQIDSSPTTAVPATTNFQSLGYSPQNTLFARTINQTECAWVKASRPNFRDLSCGLTDDSKSTTRSYLVARTAQVLTNNSDISRAAWLNDGTAILAPSTAPSIGYRAKALGIRASCRSVTDQCAKCNSTKTDTVIQCQGPNAGLTLACSASAKVNATTETFGGYVPWGPISPDNGTAIYRGFNLNPIPYGGVITSYAYFNQTLVSGGLDYFAGSTGFLQHGVGNALNVLYCDISVLDITYQFTPPETYALISSSLTDATTAGYVTYGMTSWFAGSVRGFETIDGAGRSGPSTYPELYARQLNKMVVSTITSIVPPTPADALMAGRASGTRVTLVGMLLLFILLGCTMITVICIGLHAAIVNLKSRSRFMAAARGRLISVYPLIGDSFGGLNFDFRDHKTAVSAGMDEAAFLKETESDRLHLVQELVDGGHMQGTTVRLRPRRF